MFLPTRESGRIKEALFWADQKGLEISVLGGGTNVLISDEGVKGLVISTGKLFHPQHKNKRGNLKNIH